MAVTVVLSEIQRDTLRAGVRHLRPRRRCAGRPERLLRAHRVGPRRSPTRSSRRSPTRCPRTQLDGLRQLLDALADAGLQRGADPAAREAIAARRSWTPARSALAGHERVQGPDADAVLRDARPDDGPQPELGGDRLPRPASRPRPDAPKTIDVTRRRAPTCSCSTPTSCVVGSGAGGGVIAGELAARRQARRRPRDGRLLQRGRLQPARAVGLREPLPRRRRHRRPTTARSRSWPGRTSAAARRSTGRTACARRDWVRDAVGARARARGPRRRRLRRATSTRSGSASASTTTARTTTGRTSGWRRPARRSATTSRAITRNTDRDAYDPESAGLHGLRRPVGLQAGDAEDLPAGRRPTTAPQLRRALPADEILVENGRAAGVEGTYLDDGRPRRAGGRARAAGRRRGGALETPALLLRSGHRRPGVPASTCACIPPTAVLGVYDEPQKAWWGAPQAALTEEFADIEDGYGFLVESAHASARPWPAATVPWESGAAQGLDGDQRRRVDLRLPHPRPRPRPGDDRRRRQRGATYAIADALDERIFRRGLAELVRLHEAAGAEEIFTLPPQAQPLDARRGDVEAFAQRAARRAAGSLRARDVLAAPDGLGADGEEPAPRRWPTRGASCTTRRACGSATPRPSRPRRARTRWSR